MIKLLLLISLLQAAQLATRPLFPTDAGLTPVQVHVMDPEQIDATFNDGSKGKDKKVGGWAITAADLSWCHVFVPPLTWQTIGIWQHEFKHCREGPFHD